MTSKPRRRRVQNENTEKKPTRRPVSGWSSRLIPHHALPAFLRDNDYLLNSHRQQLNSARECIKSIFRWHTETGNIWTHLAGCIAVIMLTVYFMSRPSFEVDLMHKASFSPFLAGAIFCLGCSALYHAFLCHSENVSRFCSKLDYVGVITLIVSSFFPWCYFGFYCYPTLQTVYLTLVGALGFISIVVVMQDKFGTPPYRALRAGLFIALGLVGTLPAFHYLFLEGFWHSVHFSFWLVFMALTYIAGGVIYALRIPERLLPGKCDIIGQSHQIMHMCVLVGVASCYHGANKLARYRLEDSDSCSASSAL